MLLPALMLSLAATGCGLWALVLQVRANPGAPVPVLAGRGAVDPERARGLRAAMAALTVIAVGIAATELGWTAMWLAAAPLLLPLAAAIGHNLRRRAEQQPS